MRARKGDQLIQHGRVVGQHDKVGEIVEVMGQEGNPLARKGSNDNRGAGSAKRRIHIDRLSVLQTRHLVQARPTDYTENRIVHDYAISITRIGFNAVLRL